MNLDTEAGLAPEFALNESPGSPCWRRFAMPPPFHAAFVRPVGAAWDGDGDDDER